MDEPTPGRGRKDEPTPDSGVEPTGEGASGTTRSSRARSAPPRDDSATDLLTWAPGRGEDSKAYDAPSAEELAPTPPGIGFAPGAAAPRAARVRGTAVRRPRTGTSTHGSKPTTLVQGLRGDPWWPALALVALASLGLIAASVVGTARFVSAVNPDLRFGSFTGRVNSVGPSWTLVEAGDTLVRIDDQVVDADPVRIRAVLLGLEPGLTSVLVRKPGRTGAAALVADSARLEPYSGVQRLWTWTRAVTGTLLAAIGFLAVVLRPGSGVARLFFAFCSSLSLHLLSYMAILPRPPVALVIESLGIWLAAAIGIHLFATYPRPLFVGRGWLVLPYGSAVAAVVFELAFYRRPEALGQVAQVINLGNVAAVVSCLVSLTILIVQLRAALRDEDLVALARAKALLLGVGLGLAPSTILHFVPIVEQQVDWAFNSFMVVVFAGITAHSIVRQNALDVDRFTAAVVGYGTTILVLSGVFVGLVIGLPAYLGSTGWLGSPTSVALTTGFVFIVFQPLYRKMRRLADRWFLREPRAEGTEVQVLQSLADTVRDVDVPAALRAGVDAALVLGVERCELWARAAGEELVLSVFSGPGPATTGLIGSATGIARPTARELRAAKGPSSGSHGVEDRAEERARERSRDRSRDGSGEPADRVSADRVTEPSRTIQSDGPLAAAVSEGSGGLDVLCDRAFDDDAQDELWNLDLAMAAPIFVRHRLEAMLGVARKRNGSNFSLQDRVFLDAVASQVAIAMERDWQMAKRVGPYRLRGRLGTGGMAEVFLAEKRGPGGFERRVAIKRILPHLAGDSEAIAMFLDEARIAAQLHHPNIVQVYDIEVFEDTYYLAMELMDGPSLSELLRRSQDFGGSMSLPVLARFGGALLSALDYAHGKTDLRGRGLGLVHRDVKPANILTTRRGEVKLGDFGIARAESRLYQTQPGLARGTPAYMAPELHSGESEAGIRSDLFSAGIVLLEMLTLRRAYVAAEPGKALDLDLPASLGGPRSTRLHEFFGRALASRPADRFASAEEMKAAFLRALDVSMGDSSAVIALIRAVEPEPRQPDSTELSAFRPVTASDSDSGSRSRSGSKSGSSSSG